MAQSIAMQLIPSLSSISGTRSSSFFSVSVPVPKLNHFKLGQKGSDGSAFNCTKIQASSVKKRRIRVTPSIEVFGGGIDLSQVLRYPLLTESAIKNLANDNTLVFVVDVKANKKMIRSAIKSFLEVGVKKVNTSIRADGTKKAFIQLAAEFNASDVAKRIGIFSGGS
ncbi:hypothetical protein V2J09_005692 [Rumex salicifolius]